MQREKRLPVVGVADARLAEQAARAMASQIGFDAVAAAEIAIVASELASNLIKHGGGGMLSLGLIESRGRVGLRIESKNNGPGIKNVAQAIADGFSTAGGLGCGLGAVNRLMDDVEFDPSHGGGTQVACWRWLRPVQESPRLRALDFGAATRAYRQSPTNGDAFVIKQWDTAALAGVIDGVGHGEYAKEAAQAARQYVESHIDQPLDGVFRGVDRACRSTRGVVMALARVDLHDARMAFASVGNIEARLLGTRSSQPFILRRGIVGAHAIKPVITEHSWAPPNLLVLHSDGLSTRWKWEDFPGLWVEPATAISRRLLLSLDKDEDDATVVVVRSRDQ